MTSLSRRDFLAGSAAIVGFGAMPSLAQADSFEDFIEGLIEGQTPRQGGTCSTCQHLVVTDLTYTAGATLG